MGAVFAPFAWQGGAFGSGDEIGIISGVLLGLPLRGLSQIPRFFSPHLSIDRRMVRFGPRFRRLKVVNAFTAESKGAGSSCLALDENLDEQLPILNCSQPVATLLGLRDALNEALFVVLQTPLPAESTPYRG
ncbi:MAG: hypothetical protein ACLQVI_43445 [Polyangiaceae bacterium]|jgi:hypothetical protein